MKPSELIQSRLDQQSQAQAAVSVLIRSVVEAEMTGRELTPEETSLLAQGALSPQELAAKVEAMTRFNSKIGNAVALARKWNASGPKIEQAANRIHAIELELEELRKVVVAEKAKVPEQINFGPIVEIAQANRDLLGEFADPKVLEAHVARLAAQADTEGAEA